MSYESGQDMDHCHRKLERRIIIEDTSILLRVTDQTWDLGSNLISNTSVPGSVMIFRTHLEFYSGMFMMTECMDVILNVCRCELLVITQNSAEELRRIFDKLLCTKIL